MAYNFWISDLIERYLSKKWVIFWIGFTQTVLRLSPHAMYHLKGIWLIPHVQMCVAVTDRRRRDAPRVLSAPFRGPPYGSIVTAEPTAITQALQQATLHYLFGLPQLHTSSSEYLFRTTTRTVDSHFVIQTRHRAKHKGSRHTSEYQGTSWLRKQPRPKPNKGPLRRTPQSPTKTTTRSSTAGLGRRSGTDKLAISSTVMPWGTSNRREVVLARLR
jgi:hypothetical protein